MLEILKLISKNLHYYLIFILPFLLMSCGTASNSNYIANKSNDRFETMVSYIQKTITNNPQYQTPKAKESVKSLNKFSGFLQKQVTTNKISNETAANILSEAFYQFENGAFTYKSGMLLYNSTLFPKLKNSISKHTDPWPAEDEPLM